MSKINWKSLMLATTLSTTALFASSYTSIYAATAPQAADLDKKIISDGKQLAVRLDSSTLLLKSNKLDNNNDPALNISYMDELGNEEELNDGDIEVYILDENELPIYLEYVAETATEESYWKLKTNDTYNFGDNPTKAELEVFVKGIEISNYTDLEDSFMLEFSYIEDAVAGAKYSAVYKGGETIEAFGEKFALELPENSYLEGGSQNLAISVTASSNTSLPDGKGVFLSNTFDIDANGNEFSSAPKLTLGYGNKNILTGGVNVNSQTSMYNITIAKENSSGDWVPVGGIVDSKKASVSTAITEPGKYAVILNTTTYLDVEADADWAATAIKALAHKGIAVPVNNAYLGNLRKVININGNTINDLTSEISKGEFVIMMAKAMGWTPVTYADETFSDVSSYSDDDKNYIMAAVVNGLVVGESDNNGAMELGASNLLTREEAATIAAKALNLKVENYTGTSQTKIDKDLAKYYSDNISNWAKPYVLAVTKGKVMRGSGAKNFDALGQLKYTEASQLIYNIMMEEGKFGE